MKRTIAVCLVVLMLLTGVSALAESMRVINCDEWVSLRSYASTSAPRLAVVPLGATVEAYYYEGQFVYCSYGGQYGYIQAQYLGSLYTGNNYTYSSYDVYGSYLRVVNCQSYVTLRSYPSTSAASLAQVPLGASVLAYEQTGSFTRCYYNGLTGYILTQYLGVTNTRRVINCQSFVTLRSSPSTSAAALAQVPLGATVEYLGYVGSGFAQCTYNGRTGYILEQYLG